MNRARARRPALPDGTVLSAVEGSSDCCSGVNNAAAVGGANIASGKTCASVVALHAHLWLTSAPLSQGRDLHQGYR